MTTLIDKQMTRKINTWPSYFYIGLFWALFVYIAFAWLIYHNLFRIDFTSLYSSVKVLWEGINPYQVLESDYLEVVRKLPANLNPPIVLLTFMPLYTLSYYTGMIVWYLMLLICALINFSLAGRYGCSPEFWQHYRLPLLFIYLTSFSTIMGLAIGQLGTFIAFWIMIGYHFYRKKAYHRGVLCWAYITACKFFPAVLLLFCIQQRQYRLAMYFVIYALVISLLPALFFGIKILTNYTDMMSKVMWYGDSWNASFFGVIGRLVIDTTNTSISMRPYHYIWIAVATPILIFYLTQRQLANHLSFFIALVLMLILSPFGWIYYFPLLLVAVIYTAEQSERNGYIWIWFVAFVLMNFPVDYITEAIQGGIVRRLGLFSVHFYGLLVFLCLLLQPQRKRRFHPFSSLWLPIILNQSLTLLVCCLIIYYNFVIFSSLMLTS